MFESVDLFLKAIDRAIQLLTIRTDNRRRQFKEIVEPLFRDLEPVVDDYLQALRSCQRELNSSDDLQQSRDLLANLRRELLVTRTRVRASARELAASARDEDLQKFASYAYGIFDSPNKPVDPDAKNRSDLSEVIDRFPVLPDSPRKQLADDLQSIIWRVEGNWMNAASVYARMRLKSFE